MARGINNVLLIGSLARDPELRYSPNGTAILNFTIAGDSRVPGSDGAERIVPWYQRGSFIGKQAEAASESMKAGTPVLCEGSLEYRSWENEQGQRRQRVEIKAQRLEIVRPGAGLDALVTDSIGGYRLTDAVNRATLLGNLTKDAEIRTTPNGFQVATLSLAITESWKDDQQQWQERTHFVDVTLWRELAEAAMGLTKGTPVLVTGRVTTDSWTDKEGNKRNTVKVEADRLETLTRPNREAQGKPAPQPQTRTAPARKAAPQAQARGRKNATTVEEDMPF